jgi:hypothetical protein
MNKKRKFIHRPCGGLTKRQRTVIDELFRGELNEQAVLDKHKVSRRLYNKWLADDAFTGEFDRCIESAFRQSTALIARYAPLAATKLVQLIGSDKEETVRKACLDIISMHASHARDDGRQMRDDFIRRSVSEDGGRSELNDEVASRLLSALAEEK